VNDQIRQSYLSQQIGFGRYGAIVPGMAVFSIAGFAST
jgi:hypothetical protein